MPLRRLPSTVGALTVLAGVAVLLNWCATGNVPFVSSVGVATSQAPLFPAPLASTGPAPLTVSTGPAPGPTGPGTPMAANATTAVTVPAVTVPILPTPSGASPATLPGPPVTVPVAGSPTAAAPSAPPATIAPSGVTDAQFGAEAASVCTTRLAAASNLSRPTEMAGLPSYASRVAPLYSGALELVAELARPANESAAIAAALSLDQQTVSGLQTVANDVRSDARTAASTALTQFRSLDAQARSANAAVGMTGCIF